MTRLLLQPKDDVLIVRFTIDEIVAQDDIDEVAAELSELLASESRKLLLDFQGVELMSSSMLGKLFRLSKKCDKQDITLRICNLSPDLTRVVKTVRLDRMIKVHAEVADALTAFSKQK